MHSISQKAIDLIIREEVSSEAYYRKHYTHPEWPGGASGVTIGIGYDIGYATEAKVKADWTGRVDADCVKAMLECVGVKGTAAKALSQRMNNRITVPWEAAMAVFMGRDIPQWIAATYHALPNCELLTPTCLGVLVSLNYNRGTGGYTSSADRFREMRAIKAAMAAKNFTAIPALLDSMSRLWTGGVAARRHREANLFRDGMSETVSTAPALAPEAPDPDIIAQSRPEASARAKLPTTTVEQNTTTGVIVVGGSIAAQQAHTHGLISFEVSMFLMFLAALAGISIWWTWYRNRNPA